MLVGLRLWSSVWLNRRCSLAVSGDSVTALTMVMHCRAASTKMNIIAREIALDVAESVYRPDVVVHLPGHCNVAADKLSRFYEPGSPALIPSWLAHVRWDTPPVRERSYDRASGLPTATPEQMKGS